MVDEQADVIIYTVGTITYSVLRFSYNQGMGQFKNTIQVG